MRQFRIYASLITLLIIFVCSTNFIDAVRSCKKFADAKDYDMDKTIKDWLKNASKRVKKAETRSGYFLIRTTFKY